MAVETRFFGQERLAFVDGGVMRRADNGPVRLRRNGRQLKAVGLYFSVKAGRHLPYESALELHDLWRAEVDCQVVRSDPQPFTLRIAIEGRATRYTPDRLDVMTDGRRMVVEIKNELSEAVETERFAGVAELLGRRGMEFVIRTRRVIDAEPSLSGVRAVQRHRRARLTPGDEVRMAALLGGQAWPFDLLAQQMASGPKGRALLCAAAVRRHIRIDLREGLHPDCLVELVS